eukprot:760467-Hanusia_phi.AAC.17
MLGCWERFVELSETSTRTRTRPSRSAQQSRTNGQDIVQKHKIRGSQGAASASEGRDEGSDRSRTPPSPR